MTAVDDDLLRARFAALAPEPMEPDWLDVRRRVRARRRRTLAIAALAAALVIVLVGCTAVFGPRIVSFGDADPSPPGVVRWLSLSQHAASITTPGLWPQFDPAKARRLLEEPFRGGTLAIDVAPAKGGFCVGVEGGWLGFGDVSVVDCDQSSAMGFTEPDERTQDGTVARLPRESGARSLVGWVRRGDAVGVRIRFEDGTTMGADRVVRLGPPIDAAFFVVAIPELHAHYPHRAVEVVAMRADGAVVARAAIGNDDPGEWDFPHHGAGWPNANNGFPPAADGSKAVVLHFPGTNATLAVAPARGGITCYRLDVPGSGGVNACPGGPAGPSLVDLGPRTFFPGPGAGPKHPVVLFGVVEPSVRRVELRFQDGTRVRVLPRRQFVVYDIPPRHHADGTRLVSARLLDGRGAVVRRVVFDPSMRDLYPCDHPLDPGVGPKVCP